MQMIGDRSDPFDNGAVQWESVCDPYPEFAQRRAAAALDFGNDPASDDLAVMVLRYEECATVLRDMKRFSSSIYDALMGPLLGHSLISMDDPEHRVRRYLVSPAFRQSRLFELEPMMRSILDELVDDFVAKGSTDLVRTLTLPFPVHVITRLLGLPREDAEQFARWSLAIIGAPADFEGAIAASGELTEYLRPLLRERRADPAEDLISDLCQAELDGERLSDDEIFSFIGLLLPAGFETTYRSSGNLLFGLLTHTDQLDAVRADRSLLQQAFEETLRWETPVVMIGRVAREDTELAGIEIKEGTTVGVALGSANRDERRWDRADEFDIFREPLPHIAFGAGPHACLGMHLARIEARAVAETVLDRLPNIRLDPDLEHGSLAAPSVAPLRPHCEGAHIHGEIFRSPTALPVKFDRP